MACGPPQKFRGDLVILAPLGTWGYSGLRRIFTAAFQATRHTVGPRVPTFKHLSRRALLACGPHRKLREDLGILRSEYRV